MEEKSTLNNYYKELSFLYFQKSFGKLKKVHLFKFVKKAVAREKTRIRSLKVGKK